MLEKPRLRKKFKFANSQSGMSLVEVMISIGIMSILALSMMTMQSNQVKTNNFLLFQLKRAELRAALVGQFLNDPNNCGCLFKNATPADFSSTASGVTLAVATPPVVLGRYSSSVCGTALIPVHLADSTGVDGIKTTSIQLTNITVAGGVFSGNLSVTLQSLTEVSGPKDLSLSIPVNVATIPTTPGMVAFSSCSMSAPAAATGDLKMNISVSNGRISPGWGGMGGSEGVTYQTCPGDTYVNSVSIYHAANINSISAKCVNLDGTHQFDFLSPGPGGATGVAGTLTCPAGSFAYGVQGTYGVVVNSLALKCRDTTTAATSLTATLGTPAGTGFSWDCQPTDYIFDIVTNSGNQIDGLNVRCAALP
jgi:prepilin-type N-terminal cleavage/methylation domain-containing protein